MTQFKAIDSGKVVDFAWLTDGGESLVIDFLRNHGAMLDGSVEIDEDGVVLCDNDETLDYWLSILADERALESRISALRESSDDVDAIADSVEWTMIDDHARLVNEALDDAFGAQK